MTGRQDRATLAARIDSLARLDLEGLRDAWRDDAGAPPRLRSVELLRIMLAWRIQAQVLGGLDRDTRRVLKRRGRVKPEGQHLGAGARLRRTWQNQTVEVIVTAEGFAWNDQVFASLSAVARAITGTRWNGPRFFGLRPGSE